LLQDLSVAAIVALRIDNVKDGRGDQCCTKCFHQRHPVESETIRNFDQDIAV